MMMTESTAHPARLRMW